MHLIDQTVNAQGAFIANRTPGWHQLGITKVGWTMDEILATPGLAYLVAKSRLTTDQGVTLDDRFATVRMDNNYPISVVSGDYRIVQHTDEFRKFDEVFTEFGFEYETAGVLKKGEEVFLLARIPETFELVPGDELREYVYVKFSYDGKSKTRVKACNTRVVCNNTSILALNEAESQFEYGIDHRGDPQARLDDVRKTLKFMGVAFERWRGKARVLAHTRFTESDLRQVMKAVVDEAYTPVVLTDTNEAEYTAYQKNVKQAMEDLAATLIHPLQTKGGIEGTKWSLYNAVTDYADHYFKMRTARGDSQKRAESHFKSVMDGHSASLKQVAWRLLTQAA